MPGARGSRRAVRVRSRKRNPSSSHTPSCYLRTRHLSGRCRVFFCALKNKVRAALVDKIAEDRKKLVERLNKSLAKQQSKLRFSPTDLLTAEEEKAAQAPK